MREFCPGLNRWLEYVYQTHSGTIVYYKGRRGQLQGQGHGSWQPFIDEGCIIVTDGSVEIIKSSSVVRSIRSQHCKDAGRSC